jgi:hypothetical protein
VKAVHGLVGKKASNPAEGEFHLEKSGPNRRYGRPMLRFLANLLHRPAIRSGLSRDGRGQLRNPRFVSFLAQSNRKTLDTNFHDTVLRGRRLARQGLYVLVGLGCAWVVLESARALTMF